MALLPNGLAKTGVVAGFYPQTINQSLRFEDGDGAYLSRTPASVGNRKTFTWSGWVKAGNTDSYNPLFSAGTSGSAYASIWFNAGDLVAFSYNGGTVFNLTTNAVFRDPSAWYHVVWSVDTTQATASNRMKLYVNGEQITSFSSSTYPSQNLDTYINLTIPHRVGWSEGGVDEFDGYMAEVHFVDGTSYTADAFGELKSGIWVPKDVSVTYGTNGFYLDFADGAAIGDDESGNTNDWTATNLVASDVVPDSPTNNFNVMNPALYVAGNNCTYSEGNLKVLRNASNWESVHSTMAVNSGKWYWEVYISGTNHMISVCDPNSEVGEVVSVYTRTGLWTLQDTGYRYLNFVNDTTYNGLLSFASGDVMMVAMDVDAGNVYIGKNGTWFISGDPVNGGGEMFTSVFTNSGFVAPASTFQTANAYQHFNFGQDSTFAGTVTAGGNSDANGIGDFKYAPPSGYLALCTSNLPDPVFDPAQEATADQHFNVYTYTGNGASQLIGDVVREIPDTYPISQSLRFEDGDSAHLVRTPTSNGSRTTFTWSGWVKRGNLGADLTQNPYIFGFGSSSGSAGGLRFDLDDQLKFLAHPSYKIATTRTFADPSEWLHIVIAVDTTQASVDDAYKLWVNGIRITDFSEQDNITLVTPQINETSYPMAIGRIQYSGAASNYWDGYMAEIHFVDGTTYEASDFGVFDADGLWRPIEPTVTYGTNGFHLDFNSSSYTDNASDPDEFADQANSNDWDAYNFEATDVVIDTPTNQFATISSVERSSDVRSYEGNLATSGSLDAWRSGRATTAVRSGKWYWEVISEYSSTFDERGVYGVANDQISYGDYLSDAQPDNSVGAIQFNGTGVRFYGTNSLADQTDTTFVSASDVFNFAFDADNGDLYCGRNGVWYNSGDPAAGTGATNTNLDVSNGMAPAYSHYGPSGDTTGYWNFGQDSTFAGNKTAASNADANGYGEFQYAPPSGFLALCENNLIQYDDNPLESPDLVWIKNREQPDSHRLYDSVRGATESVRPNNTGAETTETEGLTAFGKNGFTIGDNVAVNTSGEDYVAWAWKAGGTAVANTDGSINSQVSANTDAGFSIVSYTGLGSPAGDGSTIGHGLNQAPELVIFKTRDIAASWFVMGYPTNPSFPNDGSFLVLNDNLALGDSQGNEISIGDSVITLLDSGDSIGYAGNMIAYCFHSVDGFSKVGSYEGNNSTDGTFVYTGFRPKWVLIKHADSTGNWTIFDAERSTYNLVDDQLLTNLFNAEKVQAGVDFLSNGFKLRVSGVADFNNTDTYIYLAFAEQPFKYSNAR